MRIISVIIPFHRDLSEIYNAVLSIKNQYLPKGFCFQIVIGNDSKYKRKAIIDYLNLLNNFRDKIKVVNNNKEKGAGNARNIALDHANGEFICFLDADDIWKPHKTLMQLKLLLSGADFVSTGYEITGSNMSFLPANKKQFNHNIFFSLRPLGTSTIMAKSKFILSCRFDNMKFCQDILFWYKVFRKFPKIIYEKIDYSLVHYSPGGRSSKLPKVDFVIYYWWACQKADLNKIDSSKALFIYIFRGLKNKLIKNILKINFLNIKIQEIFSSSKINSMKIFLDFIKSLGLKDHSFQFIDLRNKIKNSEALYSKKIKLSKFFYNRNSLFEIKKVKIILKEINYSFSKGLITFENNKLNDSKNKVFFISKIIEDDIKKIIKNLISKSNSIFIFYFGPIEEQYLQELGFCIFYKGIPIFRKYNGSFIIIYRLGEMSL